MTLTRCDESLPSENIKKISNHFPLTITQFSDSFVLSCPAENQHSCSYLLQAVYLIHLMCFESLGMMVRGGITLGKLIHEENGALFGPAMNEAYELESKSAIYPRVIISFDAYKHLSEKLPENKILNPIHKAFDGHQICDVISMFPLEYDLNKIETKLKQIEEDVMENSPFAHPKIAYLLNQFKSRIKSPSTKNGN